MTARETVDAKARRYLIEGRLVVEYAHGVHVRAQCRGQGARYLVVHDPGGWFCSCPARSRCAHLVAVQLVTAPAAELKEVGA